MIRLHLYYIRSKRTFIKRRKNDEEVWEGMDEGTLTKTKEMLDDMHKRKIDMADADAISADNLWAILNTCSFVNKHPKP